MVEFTSPDTRPNAFGIKKEIYHRAGVTVYVIIDPASPGKRRPMSLVGFQDTPRGYEPIRLDDQGRLWVELLAVWLRISEDRVICIDGETGEEIGDYHDQVRGRQAERARAEAERARAEAEIRARVDLEARVRAMEEEIRKLRGE